MNILYRLKHWIETRIYYAVQNIQKEKNRKHISDVCAAMKVIGKNPDIGAQSIFAGMEYMEIGNNFVCGQGAWVEAISSWNGWRYSPCLVIGNDFNMRNNCHIGCVENVVIGDRVLLGSKVLITDHFHGNITKDDIDVPPLQRPLSSKPVKIGDNVWIGDNVTILPGVSLGNNVIVGANAVVTKSFLDNSVIAGVPAKVIKMLR